MKNAEFWRSKDVVEETLRRVRERIKRSTSHEYELCSGDRKMIFNRYASYEILAHWLAYKLVSEFHLGCAICSILDQDGLSRMYHPIKLLTKSPGLYCFILLPHDATNQNSRIHIVFAGTLNESGLERDLEYGGAGQESFMLEREGLLQQINDMVATVYARTKQKIKLSISGHSLGGSDAQNCAALVIKALAHNLDDSRHVCVYAHKFRPEYRAQLVNIESIDIAHLNSSGVAEVVAQECTFDASFLAKYANVVINLHALRVKDDAIHFTGQARILANVASNVANVEVLYISFAQKIVYNPLNLLRTLGATLLQSLYAVSNFKDSIALAHCSFHFSDDGDNEIFTYHNNSNEFGRKMVEEHLTKRSYLDNSLPAYAAKSLLHKALNTYYSSSRSN